MLLDEVKISWIANDGEQAIWEMEKAIDYPDVILMDINLGDDQLDGIDVMKKIRN